MILRLHASGFTAGGGFHIYTANYPPFFIKRDKVIKRDEVPSP